MLENWKKHLDTNNIVFFLFVILSFSLAWNTVKEIQRNYTLQQEVDSLKQEVDLLALENENLKLNIEYFKTDAFLELEVRQKLDKVASGETVLILPKDGDGSDAEPNIDPSG